MTQIAILLPRFRTYIEEWDRQIELMESGKLRTLNSNVDTTPESIARTRKMRDDLQALIDAHEPAS